MSMIGGYCHITPQQFDELQEAVRNNPDAVGECLLPEEPMDKKIGPELEIGKSWHGIHFLLDSKFAEASPPLPDIVFGGAEIGEDLGYGPARYMQPLQVKEAVKALDSLDKSELRARFDPAAFEAADIYPGGWTVEEPDKIFDWLWDNLMAVQKFFREAASGGDVMLLYLS